MKKTTLAKKSAIKPDSNRKKRKSGMKNRDSKEPFLKHLLFGEEKPDLSELESGSTTILDILSPTAVDTKSRDYIVVDGVFHAYLYITGYGYATTVGSCWLAPLVEAGEGVSVSFTFRRQSKDIPAPLSCRRRAPRAVPEAQNRRFLTERMKAHSRKKRRMRRSRTAVLEVLEPQKARMQNRRICPQVILILVILMGVIWKSVNLSAWPLQTG